MTQRREYLRHLAVAGLAAAACAWVAASLLHDVQHQRWDQAYLLVPVNSFWLYFAPIAFSAAIFVASKAGRHNPGLVLGATLAWLWAGGRVAYWIWIASQLAGRPSVIAFRTVVHEHAILGLAVGATGLASFFVFAFAIIESLRRTPEATSGA